MKSIEMLELVAPEFSSQAEDLRKKYLQLAKSEVPKKMQGTARTRAVATLAAHIMTLALKRQNGIGEIASRREGDVSVTYTNTPASNSGNRTSTTDLSSTNYGRTYARLIKGCSITPLTRMCF